MKIREIEASEITSAVANLCIKANYGLGDGVIEALTRARDAEADGPARDALGQLIENEAIASKGVYPLCQDTGMAVVFIELGQDAHVNGPLAQAVCLGVRRGYDKGFLRKSVVRDPIRRENTGDNTPAVIHYNVVPGDRIRITVAPKGFGSENKSRVAMLKPSDGIEGVKNFVVETARIAGPDPCPPMLLGVGVGGTMEQACLIAKQALLREAGKPSPDPFWANVEAELLAAVNSLGIGAAGLGGASTALAVHIEARPTHIAGLPVAVNVGCCATRHACGEI